MARGVSHRVRPRGPGARRAALAPTRGHLVFAETDQQMAAALMQAAAQIGLDTTWCRDGADTLLAVGAELPSVLIIAAHTETVEAPRISAAVRRHSDLPILIGAAPGEEDLARQALAAGASATIMRPYDITAIAPFAINTYIQTPEETSVFVVGPIQVNRHGYETRVRGRYVELTQRELDVLVFLIQQRGRVASSEEISSAVWGRSSDSNTVAVHIKRLRTKLGDDPEYGEYIHTIRGAGYRLAAAICA